MTELEKIRAEISSAKTWIIGHIWVVAIVLGALLLLKII